MRRGIIYSARLSCPVVWCSLRRHVNERLRGLPLTFEERHQAAVDSLLQFNIMVSQGIQPDVLMYTALIDKMGQAHLEWQAYKLFSRMLEQGLAPLPITYVALRNATSETRKALLESIKLKLEQSVAELPATLEKNERALQAKENALCEKKFEAFHSVSSLTDVLSVKADAETAAVSGVAVPKGYDPSTYATMHIRHPSEVLATLTSMEKAQSERDKSVPEAQRMQFRRRLAILHDEELRILLTINRQLRNGTKDELIERLLSCCTPQSLDAMLQRRARYFASVRTILESEMSNMPKGPHDEQQQASHDSDGDGDELAIQEEEKHEIDAQRNGEDDFEAACDEPTQLAESDERAASRDFLYTPWGLIRKPEAGVPSPRPMRNPARDNPLSDDELQMLHARAQIGEIDLVPEGILRRYARQHNLKWSRRVHRELQEQVLWHVTSFPPSEGSADGSGEPTPTAAMQESERRGFNKTISAIEALQVFAKHCTNLQVVDSREVATSMRAHYKKLRRQQKEIDAAERMERHMTAAAALNESAREFEPDDPPNINPFVRSRVRGLEGGAPPSENDNAARRGLLSPVQELPPWAVRTGSNNFHLESGTFGEPSRGEFVETSPGKFRVWTNNEARQKYSVDENFLKPDEKAFLRSRRVEHEEEQRVRESELTEKRRYIKYRRFEKLVAEAKAKKEKLKAKEAETKVEPVKRKLRMGQLLTRSRFKPLMRKELRQHTE